MIKYTRLRERIEASGLIAPEDLLTPHAATDDELLLAHDAAYIQKMVAGSLTPDEIRALGFPWTGSLVERSRRSVGATIEASRLAFDEGVAVNLAGGTHHAYRDHGAGFCVFNDAAVAARVIQE
jgi:acetoin utilization deacetylase AcuC-like enzyme